MTNYEKFMKLLHDKGYVKSLEFSINLAPVELLPDALKENVIKESVSSCIVLSLQRDLELKQAFDRAAIEIMIDKITKDLDLKKDENFNPNNEDMFKEIITHILSNKPRK